MVGKFLLVLSMSEEFHPLIAITEFDYSFLFQITNHSTFIEIVFFTPLVAYYVQINSDRTKMVVVRG